MSRRVEIPGPAALPVRVERNADAADAVGDGFRLYDDNGAVLTIAADGTATAVKRGEQTVFTDRDEAAAHRDRLNGAPVHVPV
jgi:hypothetical protein